METIFVHIASYRDPEIIPTINSILSRAQNSNRIFFGICLQETAEMYNSFPYKNHPHFRIDYIPFGESKGCCWARNRADQLYRGETYILQLDSHHRFVQNWDSILIQYLKKCPSKKAILSTYVTPYEPGGSNDKEPKDMTPCRMECEKFDGDLVSWRPVYIIKYQLLDDTPQPTYFISGHFIFTYGRWKSEVPYDPSIYFTGEEHTLALRSFTHGWDIFYPPTTVVYHMYTRKGRSKHWDDHTKWSDTDRESKARVMNVLNGHDYGMYGIGRERTIDLYQTLSGVNYRMKTLTENSRHGYPNYPPRAFKLDNSSVLSVDTNNPSIWHEVKYGNKLIATFDVLVYKTGNVMLRDSKRQLDLNVTHDRVYWKKSSDKDWLLLDNGSSLYNVGKIQIRPCCVKYNADKGKRIRYSN